MVIVYHRCSALLDVSNHVSCQHVHKFSMCWVRHFVERLWGTMIDQCCVCWCHVRKQMNCIGDKVQPKGVFRGALVTHMWHAVAKLINNHCNQISDMPPDPPHPPTHPTLPHTPHPPHHQPPGPPPPMHTHLLQGPWHIRLLHPGADPPPGVTEVSWRVDSMSGIVICILRRVGRCTQTSPLPSFGSV